MECRHLDGDPANNHIDNLCWGTRSQNVYDAIRHGTFLLGVRHPGAKLNPGLVHMVRFMAREGWTQRRIAARLGVTPGSVQAILEGRNWKHVK
jgi:hypothetical protein